MRPKGSLFWAVAVVAGLGFVCGTPTHADPTPNPGPNAVPSVTPSPEVSTSPGGEATNPFPSPSPSVAPPVGNGYAAVGYVAGSTSGGQILPTPGSTSRPSAFSSSGASGFWVDLAGRLAPSYIAALLYDNYSIHGADRPFVSYAQGRVLFQPRASRAAFGLGLVSAQRSTASANINGFGLGASLLPDFKSGFTQYASAFFYPHLQTNGKSSSLTCIEAGVLFVPPRRGGLFFRVGGSVRSGAPLITSPTSVTSLVLGLGSSF